jgi:hypothetical protein
MRSMVEGCLRMAGRNNKIYNCMNGFEHIRCRNSKRGDISGNEIRIPLRICLGSSIQFVTTAIQFDDQARAKTEKIKYIRPCWMLPPEFKSIRAFAQLLPQQYFWQCHFFAELSRTLYCIWRPTQHEYVPPLKGEVAAQRADGEI